MSLKSAFQASKTAASKGTNAFKTAFAKDKLGTTIKATIASEVAYHGGSGLLRGLYAQFAKNKDGLNSLFRSGAPKSKGIEAVAKTTNANPTKALPEPNLKEQVVQINHCIKSKHDENELGIRNYILTRLRNG